MGVRWRYLRLVEQLRYPAARSGCKRTGANETGTETSEDHRWLGHHYGAQRRTRRMPLVARYRGNAMFLFALVIRRARASATATRPCLCCSGLIVGLTSRMASLTRKWTSSARLTVFVGASKRIFVWA